MFLLFSRVLEFFLRKTLLHLFGKGPTDGLDDYWISEYSFNFTEQKNYLSLYYNGSNFCVLMEQKYIN